MKNPVRIALNYPIHPQAVKWTKLISITGSAQITIQAISLISGILIIRLLSTQEYALYTLANTMLGLMTILADSGITASVMAQGGKVWKNKDKLGVVLATGLDLRRKFAVGSLLIAIPVLLILFRHHQISWPMALLVTIALVPTFVMNLSNTLLQVPLKLHQDILPLQKNQILLNIGRLLLLLPTLVFFPFAFVAILSAGLPQLWANLRLRKLAHGYTDWNQQSDSHVRHEILSFVKRILPATIYYCVSGQITVWLISIFGSTSSIAEVGALGRLAMILTALNAMFATLVMPRFARIPENSRNVLRRYVHIHLLLFAFVIGVIAFVSLFPDQILWVLGKEYSNLKDELILSIIGSCFTLVAGISNSLAASRGWAMNPFVGIPIGIGIIILAILATDFSTTSGALLFNMLVGIASALVNGLYGLFRAGNYRLWGLSKN